MAELILKLKEREIKRINISQLETVIGRDPNCDLFIDNPAISREHASIIYRGGRFFIKDNNSSNGTFLNGEKLKEGEWEIHDGDEIQIGKYKIIFSTAGGMPENLLRASANQPKKKRPRDVFGTIQFSQQEIKNLIQAANQPTQPMSQPTLDIKVKQSEGEQDEANKYKQLTIVLGIVVAILLIILLIVFLTK